MKPGKCYISLYSQLMQFFILDRESWGGRNRARADYREYRGGGGRERYSPARTHDISPPMKRVRTEW